MSGSMSGTFLSFLGPFTWIYMLPRFSPSGVSLPGLGPRCCGAVIAELQSVAETTIDSGADAVLMITPQIRRYGEPGIALSLSEVCPWSGRGENCLSYGFLQISGLLSGLPFVRQQSGTFPMLGTSGSSPG